MNALEVCIVSPDRTRVAVSCPCGAIDWHPVSELGADVAGSCGAVYEIVDRHRLVES